MYSPPYRQLSSLTLKYFLYLAQSLPSNSCVTTQTQKHAVSLRLA